MERFKVRKLAKYSWNGSCNLVSIQNYAFYIARKREERVNNSIIHGFQGDSDAAAVLPRVVASAISTGIVPLKSFKSRASVSISKDAIEE